MSKLCVVISRHEFSQLMKESLMKERGVTEFKTVDGVFSHGWRVWEQVMAVCGRRPDLIVAVLPDALMIELMNFSGNIEIVEAEMFRDAEKWVWTGAWNILKGFRRIRVPIEYAAP